MTISDIRNKQEETGCEYMQNLIDTGMAWKMEGSVGREAVRYLKAGLCFLPTKSYRDYYGNKIPSRREVKPMTAGSLQLSKNYYENLL